ncbi:hypothetical protein DFQ26_005947 [Actinomortierella ambigua]|nr:hypothetical protein DFQ26_005947 [Actinomortierella ambigua]
MSSSKSKFSLRDKLLPHLKHQDRIGWIGLGEMGYYMAANLQKYLTSRSLNMTVWNRTRAKADKLHNSYGVRVADSIEDVVAQSNIIFTSLSNDQAVEEVYEHLIELSGQVDHEIIFCDTSTISPKLSTSIKERLAVYPQHKFLQCPVFGRPPAAKAARLIWITAGDQKAIEKLCLYFNTMSRQIIHLKTPNVGASSSFKLIGNFFIVGSMELLAEGLTLAEKSDVSTDALLKFIEVTFPSPVWTGYAKNMVEGQFGKEDGFSIDLGLKDVNHMRQLAQDSHTVLPTADLVHEHFTTLKEQNKGHQDWSSLIDAVRAKSDLPETTQAATRESLARMSLSDRGSDRGSDKSSDKSRPPSYISESR